MEPKPPSLFLKASPQISGGSRDNSEDWVVWVGSSPTGSQMLYFPRAAFGKRARMAAFVVRVYKWFLQVKQNHHLRKATIKKGLPSYSIHLQEKIQNANKSPWGCKQVVLSTQPYCQQQSESKPPRKSHIHPFTTLTGTISETMAVCTIINTGCRWPNHDHQTQVLFGKNKPEMDLNAWFRGQLLMCYWLQFPLCSWGSWDFSDLEILRQQYQATPRPFGWLSLFRTEVPWARDASTIPLLHSSEDHSQAGGINQTTLWDL